MDEELRFADAPAVPVGSVGYVYLADEMELITGYTDKTFRPNKPVTRAELTVMISKLDGQNYDYRNYDTDKGEVTYIDTNGSSKSIKLDDEVSYKLTSKTEVVFEDDVDGDITDIKVGDDVKVKVNKDDEVVYIEVDRELYYEDKGEVTDIDTSGTSKSIELDDEESYKLTNDTEVVFEDDIEGNITDIKIGDDVEVKVNEDDEVVYIEVDRELYTRDYSGIVTEIDDDEFFIYTSNKIVEFDIDEDFRISFKDRDGTIENLRVGDAVEVVVEDEEVEKITVNRDREIDSNIIQGKLGDIYSNTDQIVVKNGTEYKIYTLDDDVKIYLNTSRVLLSKLEKDDNVRLEMYREKVIELNAYRY